VTIKVENELKIVIIKRSFGWCWVLMVGRCTPLVGRQWTKWSKLTNICYCLVCQVSCSLTSCVHSLLTLAARGKLSYSTLIHYQRRCDCCW